MLTDLLVEDRIERDIFIQNHKCVEFMVFAEIFKVLHVTMKTINTMRRSSVKCCLDITIASL